MKHTQRSTNYFRNLAIEFFSAPRYNKFGLEAEKGIANEILFFYPILSIESNLFDPDRPDDCLPDAFSLRERWHILVTAYPKIRNCIRKDNIIAWEYDAFRRSFPAKKYLLPEYSRTRRVTLLCSLWRGHSRRYYPSNQSRRNTLLFFSNDRCLREILWTIRSGIRPLKPRYQINLSLFMEPNILFHSPKSCKRFYHIFRTIQKK